jgi:hypothetical protein
MTQEQITLFLKNEKDWDGSPKGFTAAQIAKELKTSVDSIRRNLKSITEQDWSLVHKCKIRHKKNNNLESIFFYKDLDKMVEDQWRKLQGLKK